MPTRVFRGERVLLPGGLRPAAIQVLQGRIVAIGGPSEFAEGETIECGSAVLMPGVVDTHVHLNEPGRTEWEGVRTATRAAAAGGVTALVDMPLNSIPATTTLQALEQKRAAARGQCAVDLGFWGGVVPGNLAELAPMVRAGARGFKCFLVDSGVPEFERVSERDLRPALAELARLQVPLLVHAELPGPLRKPQGDGRLYANYLASRPRAAEDEAVGLLARLCSEIPGARVHVVHLSSADALPWLFSNPSLSAETCPHYLHFASEDIPDGATAFKCAPPIRESENRERLWAALGAGLISMIASDHSPCTPALKELEQGDFSQAWGGISGLQLALPVVWTEASRRGFDLSQLSRWMSLGPARLAGLGGRKGALTVGADADFCLFEPEARFRVEPARIEHRHKLTPYAGEELVGLVRSTWLRGERVFDADGGFSAQPLGEFL